MCSLPASANSSNCDLKSNPLATLNEQVPPDGEGLVLRSLISGTFANADRTDDAQKPQVMPGSFNETKTMSAES